ncbi:MAG: hypothetical protein M1164_02090 [Candidatus Marsarchaeota archaeon]|jgi:hypothetical protein|nr:hypothetical protein [Candidatus Marsarchaeota archaeon]
MMRYKYRERMLMKHIEDLIRRIAYASVALDFIVAFATLFYTRNVEYSGNFLVIGDYLIMLEVMTVTVASILVLYIKYRGYLFVALRSAVQKR